MELMLNNAIRARQNDSDKILFHCHSVHHKSRTDWPGKEFASPWVRVKLLIVVAFTCCYCILIFHYHNVLANFSGIISCSHNASSE